MTTRGSISYAVSRDGTRIAWMARGSGPSIIFVPPWTETIESGYWYRVVRREFKGRIVTFDRRGFGRSDWGVEHGLEQYADDLEAVADAAGLDQVTLYGAAAGVLDSVVLAARTPRVARMLLLEPVLRVERDDLQAQKSLYALLDHDLETFWRAFLQFAIGWGKPADIERQVSYYVSATNLQDIRATLDVLLNKADLSPFAPLVQADCLLIHNADDSLMPPASAAALARLLPRQRLLITSGDRWSRDEATQREIESFLAGEWGATGSAAPREGVERATGAGSWDTLTPREAEILAHVAAGATNDEIATALWLSRATVARHLANVFAKLNVRNRVEAANWARDHEES